MAQRFHSKKSNNDNDDSNENNHELSSMTSPSSSSTSNTTTPSSSSSSNISNNNNNKNTTGITTITTDQIRNNNSKLNNIIIDPYSKVSITIFLKISPWDEIQTVDIDDTSIEIGDIKIFFKEKGVIKIRELSDYYSLFKYLEPQHSFATTTTSSIINNIQNNNNSGNSSSSTGGKSRRRLLLSNDHNNNNSSHHTTDLPRWYYKDMNQIIEDIKSKTTITIESPIKNKTHHVGSYATNSIMVPQKSTTRTISHSFNGNTVNNDGTNHWNFASPTASSFHHNHQYSKSPPSPSSSPSSPPPHPHPPSSSLTASTNQSWLFANTSRVHDVVHRIESQFPWGIDSNIDTFKMSMDNCWEARISSSDDTFIRNLTMEDSLGGELVKQEYIEFSLRFENRTSLLIGVEHTFTVWIDPIQTFFTLACSSNTTVHDAVYFIVQYLYPMSSSNSKNGANITNDSFMSIVSCFGLYLQEASIFSTTPVNNNSRNNNNINSNPFRLVPLQHKQLLLNCILSKPHESLFIFKAKKTTSSNTNSSSSSSSSTSSSQTSTNQIPFAFSTPISILSSSTGGIGITTNNSNIDIDEEEGYNLTVLFPTHQTYRQFHFIPNSTVNEAIQSILSATCASTPYNNSKVDPTNIYNNNNNNNNPTTPKTLSPPILSPQQQQQQQQSFSPMTTNITSNNNPLRQMIFDNNEEASGYCLYFQKDGSGVWMEGDRTLTSYNLPNETVVEFKPPPSICKLSLIEGVNKTARLLYNQKTCVIVYGRFTLISELEELILNHIDPGNEELPSYGLFFIKDKDYPTPCKDHEYLYQLNLKPSDYLEFKRSSDASVTQVTMNAAMTFGSVPKQPNLYPGETILTQKTFSGERIINEQPKKGYLTLTNYRLIFNAINRSSYIDLTTDDIDIPITTILKLKLQSNGFIEIQCKDFRICIFYCPEQTLWANLKYQFEAPNILKTFAFSNLECYDRSLETNYYTFDEFERLKFPVDKWRVTHINRDYQLCPTYPATFIVPASISDEDLKKIAMFREKGRVPAICWIHQNHHSTITRCSQPRVGLSRSRCNEDEKYLKIIAESNTNSNVLYVMDSRPMANAKANTLLGKGHENTSLYQNVELQFLGIGNIHVMRESYKKLYALIQNPESPNWFSQIDGTQWLEHIYQLINSANMVVELVDKKGCSVLTHCSDGWDRTSQLVALSQLLLDPYYRTIKGFQLLIEKEWLSFGHLFSNRCSHVYPPNGDDHEFSPIFMMFIDAVWQLTCLLPTTFQFNERFLIKIIDSVYDCRYGTFLFNNERERMHFKKMINGPASLWSAINAEPVDIYTNCFYVPNSKPIFENFFMADIQFWTSFYLRWNDKFKPRPKINNVNTLKEIEDYQKWSISQQH
eukprot:gene5622-6997_t